MIDNKLGMSSAKLRLTRRKGNAYADFGKSLSSLEVILLFSKMSKIVLGFAGVDLQMLVSRFGSFPAGRSFFGRTPGG